MTEMQLRRMFPNASAEFIRKNLGTEIQEARGKVVAPSPAVDSKPEAPRLRQRQGPKLNKTETAFLEWLCARYDPKDIRAQAVTLVIGNGVRYTVDFTNLRAGLAWETKGPYARDDSIVKIKVAASLYPEIKFHLVTRDGPGWSIQEMIP